MSFAILVNSVKEYVRQENFVPKKELIYYEKMVNDLLTSYGLDPEKCRHRLKTLWSAYRGFALIYTEIFTLDDIDYLEISCPIILLPSQNLLPFYRKLLEINCQLIGIKFLVRDQWVYIAEERELAKLDFEELKAMVERVSYTADRLDELLIDEFKSRNL
ncbi:MAG: YbjN domain-containing protein [bacterium]